jgi:hypothetical protein
MATEMAIQDQHHHHHNRALLTARQQMEMVMETETDIQDQHSNHRKTMAPQLTEMVRSIVDLVVTNFNIFKNHAGNGNGNGYSRPTAPSPSYGPPRNGENKMLKK